jgi:hypothetical protein
MRMGTPLVDDSTFILTSLDIQTIVICSILKRLAWFDVFAAGGWTRRLLAFGIYIHPAIMFCTLIKMPAALVRLRRSVPNDEPEQ